MMKIRILYNNNNLEMSHSKLARLTSEERDTHSFTPSDTQGASQLSDLANKIYKSIVTVIERGTNHIRHQVRRIIIEEIEAAKEKQRALNQMELGEEHKARGERKELEAKIRAVDDFLKEIHQIGKKIEKELESEVIEKIMTSTVTRVKSAFLESNQRLEQKMKKVKSLKK